MSRANRRTGRDRRSGKDRRKRNDPNYKGPERRSGKNRRSGEDRRRVYRVGSRIADRYEIRQIFGGEGKSSMGIVYICYDHKYDQVVALKTLQKRLLYSKKVIDSFKKEALAWMHLEKHPYIVRAYWVRELDYRMFISSECIHPDGRGRTTLNHYLNMPFSLQQVLKWAIQFCYGMEYVCAKGVAPHRDIKPDNIMITIDGDVKITDFGLVGLWDKADQPEELRNIMKKSRTELTFLSEYNDRVIAGSPPWMAPEQFYGVAKVSSDIYSFGIVLFQLTNNGELPFQPKAGDNWGIAHKTYPVPSVSRKGRMLEKIIKKCLEKRRDKRYEDFRELRKDLEKIFRKEITKKTGEKPPAPPELEQLREAELINKGMSLANLGLADEAITKYREGIKINPDNAYAHYNLGNALSQKNLFDGAIKEFREAIRIDPDFADAHYNLGLILFRKGLVDEAIKEYNETLRINPGFAEAHVNLGVALSKKSLLDDAIKAYGQAIRIKPDFADAYHRIGIAFFKKGLLDDAIKAFREALRIRPEYAEAYNNLGSALLQKHLTDEAISAYGKAVMIKPGYADAYYNIGAAFIRKKLYREAIHAFREFIKYAQNHDKRLQKAQNLIRDLQQKLA